MVFQMQEILELSDVSAQSFSVDGQTYLTQIISWWGYVLIL